MTVMQDWHSYIRDKTDKGRVRDERQHTAYACVAVVLQLLATPFMQEMIRRHYSSDNQAVSSVAVLFVLMLVLLSVYSSVLGTITMVTLAMLVDTGIPFLSILISATSTADQNETIENLRFPIQNQKYLPELETITNGIN